MTKLLEYTIEDNIEQTKDKVLDLGFCGLKGGEESFSLLRKENASHIKTLILCDEWQEYNASTNQFFDLASQNESGNLKNDIAKLTLPALPNLETLILDQNQRQGLQKNDLQALWGFKNLKVLNLASNNLTSLAGLEELVNLEVLNVNNNKLNDESIQVISELVNLKMLFIDRNEISDIAALSKLPHLEVIFVEGNKITNIHLDSFLSCRRIAIGNNPISKKAVNALSNLKKLEFLELSNLQMTSIALSDLPSLKSVNLRNNELTNATIVNANCLEEIQLSGNALESITLKNLESLPSLNLKGQALKELTIQNLPVLETLNLKENRLKEFSLDYLKELPGLKDLKLQGNPIKNIDKEVFDADKNVYSEVRDFLHALESGKSYLHRAKLILVGNGEVGKTSIRLRLLDEAAVLPTKEERTQGFDLAVAPYKIEKIATSITQLDREIDFDLHIWDFGGQGRYREVQQLFCSRKSLYLFVTSPDDRSEKVAIEGGEENEDYVGWQYWLSMANAFSYDQDSDTYSPIIHIINKIDKDYNFVVNSRDRQDVFQNISHHLRISCQTMENFATLKETILSALPKVSEDIFTAVFPKSWEKINNHLEELKTKHTYINYQQFLDICEKYGVTDTDTETPTKTLIRTLDRMGYVIYYGNNKYLKDWVILNPRWVKDAIYKVLDANQIVLDAKFRPIHFEQVWSEYAIPPSLFSKALRFFGSKNYTNTEHEKLVALMLAYEFCYEQTDKNGTYYLIPALLGEKPSTQFIPEEVQSFDYQIKLMYEPFLPAGTLNKLIVRLHKRIYDDLKWKNGVVLQDAANAAYAEVTEAWAKKSVFIQVKKVSNGQIAPLIKTILETLQALNEDLKSTKYLASLDFSTYVKCEDGNWKLAEDFKYRQPEDYQAIFGNEATNVQKVTENALNSLRQGDFACYFETLEDLIPQDFQLRPLYIKLKSEYVAGAYQSSLDFSARLAVFTQQVLEYNETL